jgi:hypothetical protein
MRKALSILAIFVTAAAAAWLCGCASVSLGSNLGTGGSNQLQTSPGAVPVSLTITDDPPAGVSVLFFQVSLTAASLQPTSQQSTAGTPVSLLPNGNPIEIDVTQLQALSAFLSTVNVPAGNYSSLSLTFANPQLVIFNNSDQSIAGTCAVGNVCQLTPTIDNSATVNLSSSPFPVTVAANSPLGFLIDFHLNTIIQSDLSVNLGAANGVSVSQLKPPSAPTGTPLFGTLVGSVATVSSSLGQFTLQTPDGRSFTISTSSSTAYDDFPASACSAAGFSCIAQGDIVRVQVSSVQTGGILLAAQITYVQTPSQQTVVGTIVGIPPLPLPTGETVIQLILHQNPTASTSLPLGAMALVAVWAPGTGGHTATTFSIDSGGFTIPSGFTFASSNDLCVGQTVQVTIVPGSLQPSTSGGTAGAGGWGPPPEPSFTASSLQLEPSQLTGTVSAISSPDFTLSVASMPPCGVTNSNTIACPQFVALIPYDAVTTSQTTYQGFSTDDFGGLADNDMVSVSGWLFSPSGSTTMPAIVPKNIVLRTTGI